MVQGINRPTPKNYGRHYGGHPPVRNMLSHQKRKPITIEEEQTKYWAIVLECETLSDLHNHEYGPFHSVSAAEKALEHKGWKCNRGQNPEMWFTRVARTCRSLPVVRATIKTIKLPQGNGYIRNPDKLPPGLLSSVRSA